MFRSSRSTRVIAAAVTLGLAGLTLTGAASSDAHPAPAPKPTIVLVHGAWADGSSWSAVTDKLQRRGYTVDVEPNPLRGVKSDSGYLRDYLHAITGPIVLVGHSYGGMIITNAATGNANVKALVYVDAFIPEVGDSAGSLSAAQPGSALTVPDPSTVLNFVPASDKSGLVDLYVKPALFPAIFAGGVAPHKAAVLAAGQRPLALSALSETSPGEPAWKTIPSWDLIGTADKVIPAAEQEIMAARAGSHVVRVNAPHLSMVARPAAVTDLIAAAAAHS